MFDVVSCSSFTDHFLPFLNSSFVNGFNFSFFLLFAPPAVSRAHLLMTLIKLLAFCSTSSTTSSISYQFCSSSWNLSLLWSNHWMLTLGVVGLTILFLSNLVFTLMVVLSIRWSLPILSLLITSVFFTMSTLWARCNPFGFHVSTWAFLHLHSVIPLLEQCVSYCWVVCKSKLYKSCFSLIAFSITVVSYISICLMLANLCIEVSHDYFEVTFVLVYGVAVSL